MDRKVQLDHWKTGHKMDAAIIFCSLIDLALLLLKIKILITQSTAKPLPRYQPESFKNHLPWSADYVICELWTTLNLS